MARSQSGLNGISDRLHPFVRDVILAGRLRGKTRPVHYNGWEAIYFDHDLATLKGLADLAAEAGGRTLCPGRRLVQGPPRRPLGLGDWTVDPAKYPDGLTPLIDHVRGLGMEFGLWVEPEMAKRRLRPAARPSRLDPRRPRPRPAPGAGAVRTGPHPARGGRQHLPTARRPAEPQRHRLSEVGHEPRPDPRAQRRARRRSTTRPWRSTP
jgi:hypothetical protein